MIGNSFYSPKDILNKNSNSLLELNDSKPNSKKLYEKEIKIISRKSSIK